MAELEKEKIYAEISEMPQWRSFKTIMEEGLKEICDIEKIESFEEMCGAKFCNKWVKNMIRKIDGAKDFIDSNIKK